MMTTTESTTSTEIPSINSEALDAFALPEGWRIERLGDYCYKPDYGYTESATNEPIGPKFLRITDIQDGGVDWNAVPYCKATTNAHRDSTAHTP